MNKYSIIKADIRNNQDDIFPILIKNLQEPSSDKYVWAYIQCPYGTAQCWLAKHEQTNTFIGTSALFPRVILVKGEPVYAAIAGDFAVDIHHRSLIAALALQREIQSKITDTGFRIIYGLPNKHSKGILLKIGYKKIGKFSHFIKPLKSEYKDNNHLHSLLRLKIFAGAVDILIKGFSKENRYKTPLKYSVITPDHFDDRFDAFWNTVSRHFTIIGERTSVFLNWRYMESPVREYKIFCLVNEQNDIIGYIVYFLENNMCHITDMLFEPSAEIISSLLAEFSRFMQKKGAGSISVDYLGGCLLEKKLREFNFLPINSEADLIIYSSGPVVTTDLLNKENWHFFAGDNDV